MDDVIINKAAIIERCIRRVREEYADTPENLTSNLTRQDSIILNIQRACEASIDLAMHLVRIYKLGIPQESREAFSLLANAGKISPDLAQALQRMVGFRNVAVHNYQQLNLQIVQAIVTQRLGDLLIFTELALKS